MAEKGYDSKVLELVDRIDSLTWQLRTLKDDAEAMIVSERLEEALNEYLMMTRAFRRIG